MLVLGQDEVVVLASSQVLAAARDFPEELTLPTLILENCLRDVSWSTIVPLLPVCSNLLAYFFSKPKVKQTKPNPVFRKEFDECIHH